MIKNYTLTTKNNNDIILKQGKEGLLKKVKCTNFPMSYSRESGNV